MIMVQIPRLQQAQSVQQAPKTERLRIKAPNQAQNILNRTQSIASLGEQAANMYQQYENDKITQLSQEAQHEYKAWHNERLTKLRTYEGDPTEAYANFEQEEVEKYTEILNKKEGLSERTKRHLTANLDKTRDVGELQMLKQRGAQEETYANNLFETSVKSQKDNLSVSAGYIRKEDDGSFLPFDQGLSDIKTTIAKRQIKYGGAKILPSDAKTWSHIYRDEDGEIVKVSMNNIAKARVAKELSEGVSTSINNLIEGGQKEEAKIMLEKYKGYLDPKTNTKINKKIEKVGKKDEAYNIVREIEAKPKADQITAIEKIKDPEVRGEVLKIKAANDRAIASLRQRQQEANYDRLLKYTDSMRESGKLNGMSDLENVKGFDTMWEKLSHKQQKAIKQEVENPKTTDTKALVKMQALFLGQDKENKIDTMSDAKFREYLVGLNKDDRKKWQDKFASMKTGSGNIKKQAWLYNQGSKMLLTKLYAKELIDNNDYNKLEGDDFDKVKVANDMLLDYLDSFPEGASYKDLSESVDKFIKEQQKAKLFKGYVDPGPSWAESIWNKFTGETKAKDPVRTTVQGVQSASAEPDVFKGMKNREILKWQVRYKREKNLKGYPTPDDKLFQTYVNNRKND